MSWKEEYFYVFVGTFDFSSGILVLKFWGFFSFAKAVWSLLLLSAPEPFPTVLPSLQLLYHCSVKVYVNLFLFWLLCNWDLRWIWVVFPCLALFMYVLLSFACWNCNGVMAVLYLKNAWISLPLVSIIML